MRLPTLRIGSKLDKDLRAAVASGNVAKVIEALKAGDAAVKKFETQCATCAKELEKNAEAVAKKTAARQRQETAKQEKQSKKQEKQKSTFSNRRSASGDDGGGKAAAAMSEEDAKVLGRGEEYTALDGAKKLRDMEQYSAELAETYAPSWEVLLVAGLGDAQWVKDSKRAVELFSRGNKNENNNRETTSLDAIAEEHAKWCRTASGQLSKLCDKLGDVTFVGSLALSASMALESQAAVMMQSAPEAVFFQVDKDGNSAAPATFDWMIDEVARWSTHTPPIEAASLTGRVVSSAPLATNV